MCTCFRGGIAAAYFSLLLLGVATPLSAQEAKSDAEQIRSLVVTSLMSWQTMNESEFTDTAHPDLVFAYPGKRTDRDGALKVFRMWKDKFRDTKVYVHQVLVEGNRFSAEYQFATTKKSTGKRSVMGTTAVGSVQDGLIIVLKEYTDGQVDDLQVQGKLPLDEGAEPFPWPLVD